MIALFIPYSSRPKICFFELFKIYILLLESILWLMVVGYYQDITSILGFSYQHFEKGLELQTHSDFFVSLWLKSERYSQFSRFIRTNPRHY